MLNFNICLFSRGNLRGKNRVFIAVIKRYYFRGEEINKYDGRNNRERRK